MKLSDILTAAAALFLVILIAAGWQLYTLDRSLKSVTSRSKADGPTASSDDRLTPLTTTQRATLKQWLAANPGNAIIRTDYCHCTNDNTPNPYITTGDFNGDGQSDFAILLENRDAPSGPEKLLVFNGPLPGRGQVPPFEQSGLEHYDTIGAQPGVGHDALFVGPPDSDNGYSVSWKEGVYELHYAGAPLSDEDAAEAAASIQCPKRPGFIAGPFVPTQATAEKIYTAAASAIREEPFKEYPVITVTDKGDHWAATQTRLEPRREVTPKPGVSSIMASAGGGQLYMSIDKCTGAVSDAAFNR